MKYDCIEIDGKSYRIEFAWAALQGFIDDNNLKFADIERIPDLSADIITSLCYHGICIGCEMDNVEFPYSLKQFSLSVSVYDIADIISIFRAHTETAKEQKKRKVRFGRMR